MKFKEITIDQADSEWNKYFRGRKVFVEVNKIKYRMIAFLQDKKVVAFFGNFAFGSHSVPVTNTKFYIKIRKP